MSTGAVGAGVGAVEVPYPPAPAGVPADLARPTSRFRAQAWGAVLGLAIFLVLYAGLAAWFGWTALRFARVVLAGEGGFFGVLAALGALFLLVVLVKGVFFVRRSMGIVLVEVREEDEPQLIRFVHRIADDAGAPRPHRVYLSPHVNAGVFYDLAFWNLLFPSKKNLEIGLGLVNTLSLDELKAVVAHEFGHFAQRSMSVGAWVYLSRQVVAAVVGRRDAFDRFLEGLSRIDLRIAWIGWIMRLVVWAVRAVLDTAFRGVIALERALGRQMELQADLVSVKLSGSDSLIHALHRLGAADDAWARAEAFALDEAAMGRRVADVYALQSRVLDRMGAILDEPDHGRTPRLPDEGRDRHRLFRSGIADVPRMWQSHPPNHDREQNAKRVYVPSVLDDRPAWVLFRDPERARAELTAKLVEEVAEQELPAAEPVDASLGRIDALFSRSHLDRRYRGAYLGRPVARAAAEARELFDAVDASDRAVVLRALDGLYPESLAREIERVEELGEEKALLEGLHEGFLEAPGGVIQHRGRVIRRRELPELVRELDRELETARRVLLDHDRAVRTAHRAAARVMGRGWEEQLVGLVELLHWVEHVEADLLDARDFVQHVLVIVTADQKVTASELERLRAAAADEHRALRDIFDQRQAVRLPASIAEGLGVEAWSDALPPTLDIHSPSADDLAGDWLPAMASWVGAYTGALGALWSRTLDALVESEAHVERCLRSGEDPGDAPAPAAVPERFARRRPGEERPRQKRLDAWSRFMVADGPLPGAARLLAASAVLGPMLFFSWHTGVGTIAVHNGLEIPVVVSLGGEVLELPPHGSGEVSHQPGEVQVSTVGPGGKRIERFEGDVPGPASTVVYNVAGASAFVEWDAAYGNLSARPPGFIGAKRWFETEADVVLREPPRDVRTRGGGARKRVLEALDDAEPSDQGSTVVSSFERLAMALAHARWDPTGHPALQRWLEVAPPGEEIDAVLGERLAAGGDLVLWRAQIDRAGPEERGRLCEVHRRRAAERAADADAAYLAARCGLDQAAGEEALLAAFRRFPDHVWLRWAMGRTHARHGRWGEASSTLEPLLGDRTAIETFGVDLGATIARVRRVAEGSPVEAPVGDVATAFPRLEPSLYADGWTAPPEGASPMAVASFHLSMGRLQEALEVDGLGAPLRLVLARLVAASEGASEGQIEAGLSLDPGQGIDRTTFWPSVALAVREGRDSSALRALGPSVGAPAAVVSVLDAGVLAGDPAALDRAVDGLGPEDRGAARVAGIVLLGEQAPAAWRVEARGLLFAGERPYLRP